MGSGLGSGVLRWNRWHWSRFIVWDNVWGSAGLRCWSLHPQFWCRDDQCFLGFHPQFPGRVFGVASPVSVLGLSRVGVKSHLFLDF